MVAVKGEKRMAEESAAEMTDCVGIVGEAEQGQTAKYQLPWASMFSYLKKDPQPCSSESSGGWVAGQEVATFMFTFLWFKSKPILSRNTDKNFS